MVKKFISKTISIHEVAENTTQVDFDIPQEGFDFTAGQYVSITIPSLSHLPVHEQFHDFSIASAPYEKVISIAFRNNEKSEFKKALKEKGLEVEISGPKGVFTLPEEVNKEDQLIAFIAGGIGITPFFSMIKQINHENKSYKIVLFYYNRNKERATYLKELEEISKTNKNISLAPVFGPIDGSTINNFMKDSAIKPSDWYIAGPPGMVRLAREILSQNEVNDDTIKTEEFSGY